MQVFFVLNHMGWQSSIPFFQTRWSDEKDNWNRGRRRRRAGSAHVSFSSEKLFFLWNGSTWLLLPKVFEAFSMCGFTVKKKKPRKCEVGLFRQSKRAARQHLKQFLYLSAPQACVSQLVETVKSENRLFTQHFLTWVAFLLQPKPSFFPFSDSITSTFC